jgi:uncharacterized integral membrane protein
MNAKTFKGGVLVGLSLVLLIAALVLALMNLGNKVADLHLYWRTFNNVNVGLVLLLAAAVGALLPTMVRMLIRGIRQIRGGRLQQRLGQLADAATQPKDGP